jgi:hypothetical protein
MEARLLHWNLSPAMACSIAAPCLGKASFLQAQLPLAQLQRSPAPLPSR